MKAARRQRKGSMARERGCEFMATQSEAITRADPRYDAIFNVENETLHGGYAMIDDPYPALAGLRAQGPVFRGQIIETLTGLPDPQFSLPGRPHFTTLSFGTCSKALEDNLTYSSELYLEVPLIMETFGRTILQMVGKEHARYRSSIQPALTRDQAMGWWRENWIVPIVDALIAELKKGGEAELVTQFCGRVPMHTVTAAYGLTTDEALAFRENLIAIIQPAVSPERRAECKQVVRSVLMAAIQERRRERRDDLISRLMDSTLTDENGNKTHLTDEDILSFSRLLLLAGGGTTFRQMGITIFALLSNRDQLEDLRADRSLMHAAIQESVRWHCTDPVFYRVATRDSELGGVEIPAGAVVNICLAAGNHDPERWENPERYDLHRPLQRHIGFASGPHMCLGRFIAEAEMTTAINALLDNFPNLRLAEGGEPARLCGGMMARGMNHLRVRYD
jgi:cytochrome P450